MTLRKEDIELINKLADQTTAKGSEPVDDILFYRRVLETSGQWQVPGQTHPDFSSIVRRMEDGAVRKHKEKRSTVWYVAASVSLLALAVSVWLIYFSSIVTVDVPVAQIKTIWLPDSSKVILNAESELSYSRRAWENEQRLVELSGIAYFEVRKGSRFTVQTLHGQVTVLGTSFNVKALPYDFVVECITGKVAVSGLDETHRVELTPGFKVEKDADSELLLPARFDRERSKEWLSGVFNFTNQPLDFVWKEFERQFDVQVDHATDDPRFYTGTFSNTDMNKALDAICKPMGLAYKIDNENKLITIND